MGYWIDSEIYQGISITLDLDIERNSGNAAALLLNMIEKLPNRVKRLQFSLLFTFEGIRSYWYNERDNRIPKSCPLSDKKDPQKKTDAILVVKWDDSSIVTIATNRYGISPVTNVRRYEKKKKKHIQVSRPALLAEYNKKNGWN
nr:unnamed protein product [Callosobruchus analis]